MAPEAAPDRQGESNAASLEAPRHTALARPWASVRSAASVLAAAAGRRFQKVRRRLGGAGMGLGAREE